MRAGARGGQPRSAVAGEARAAGTFMLQLVLDEGAWEEVVALTAEDAEVMQALLELSSENSAHATTET